MSSCSLIIDNTWHFMEESNLKVIKQLVHTCTRLVPVTSLIGRISFILCSSSKCVYLKDYHKVTMPRASKIFFKCFFSWKSHYFIIFSAMNHTIERSKKQIALEKNKNKNKPNDKSLRKQCISACNQYLRTISTSCVTTTISCTR